MDDFRTLRLAAAISIPDAAKAVGVATSTAYRWDKGEVAATPDVLDRLRSLRGHGQRRGPGTFKFIDLFAGIGGLRRGFDGIGGRCVFTSEWNTFAQATYLANYYDGPEHQLAGDITKVDEKTIPDHDVLLAGFPCQPFSIAGVSKKNALGRQHGFLCDTQGTLFFDVARIIAAKQPKVILLENVKNLLSHDKGNTFAVIKRTLEEDLGYDISPRLIDGRCLVPQHRERIYIAGVRRDLGIGLDLNAMQLPPVESGPKMKSILHPEDGSDPIDPDYLLPDGSVHSRYTLSDKLWGYLQDYAAKHKAKGNGFGFGLVDGGSVARTLSARYHKDGSEILVSRGDGKNPRRLTPRECARLMGFDAPGRSDFLMPVSDTQAYRQFGNSVVVPVVEAVAQHMSPAILQAVGKVASVPAMAAE